MEDERHTETLRFTSTDKKTTIHAVIWWPETQPIGVVQLVHGMAEHIMRYEPFAHFLNERGFVVCGHDHLGHGESVASHDDWGHIPIHEGRSILVGDVGRLRALMRERVDKSLPYFIFGHSMGSFVVRAYVSECGQGLAGAIICGTGHIPPMTSVAGNTIARIIGRVRGERYVSKLLGDLSVGAYAKAIDNAQTPLDWLSYNEQNVQDYIADERCGFAFTTGGNATLTALTREVCSPSSLSRIPKDLPLLFIAGAEDPVGDMGKGVRIAADMARKAGIDDVTCTIYDHMRHEILNEDDCERVMGDIATWMEDHI